MTAYQAHIDRVIEAQNRRTASGQEIGDIPDVVDAGRRQAAEESYSVFCATYFPYSYTLPWAPFHFKAAETFERAIHIGGRFAFAMPRGSGKSKMCEWAVLWAVLNGHVEYVALFGATLPKGEKRLKSIKTELRTNELLLADYPEVCYPIRKLENSVRRAEGQKHNGRHTGIVWKRDQLVFPTIEGSKSSGAILEGGGVWSELRGMSHTTEDGRTIRPQLAIVDDAQTRASAKSPTITAELESVLAGDIAYLAGPAEPIAVVFPCTVIYRGDLADRLLDRDLYPQWKGERTKLVITFPKEMELWGKYYEIMDDSYRDGGDGAEATTFYRENQSAMDAGAEVSWPERFDREREISAIQHAMNLRHADEAAFMAEYQNDPILAGDEPEWKLEPKAIAAKQNGYARRIIPSDCQHVSAFVDVQSQLLFYAVVAWEQNFNGYAIDYGTWPEQPTRQFSLRSCKNTLSRQYKGMNQEQRIYAGLTDLTEYLCGQTWHRTDGAEMYIGRLLIDANWSESTQLVYKLCKESPRAAIITPSHGVGVKASDTPWSEYKRKRGEERGHRWRILPPNEDRDIRRVIFDTNFWKTANAEAWHTPVGGSGALTLYGKNGDVRVGPREHINIATHQCAWYPVRVEAKGRTVIEWKEKPHRPDDHWGDCLVGCRVGASMLGIVTPGTEAPPSPHVRRARRITAEMISQHARV